MSALTTHETCTAAAGVLQDMWWSVHTHLTDPSHACVYQNWLTKHENWAVTLCLNKYIETQGCPATLDTRWIYLHCWVCMRLIGKMYSSLVLPRQYLTCYVSNKHPRLAEITADEINALEEQMFLFFLVALEDGPLAKGLRSLGDANESDSDEAGSIH